MSTAEDPRAPWLTDAQTRDWRSLVALVNTLPAALDAQLRRNAGLNTFEYHILVELDAAAHRTVAMTDLALLTRSSPSRLSHAVSRLEQAGWVERGACAEAGRRTSARLTDAGLSKLQDAAPGHVREARRLVVDALTPDELATLGAIARRVVAGAAPAIAVPDDGPAA